MALATNTTQFAQYDNGIDADYNGKLAASEDRADWMTVLSVQHPGALSQADADMTGLAYQRFLTGSGLAERNAALAQSAADLLAANTDAGAVHTASEAQAAADRAAAVQAANDLFVSITAQIDSNVAQGQFYVPPWSPAPLSPFGQFGGYLAGSADISGARIAFDPRPSSPVYASTYYQTYLSTNAPFYFYASTIFGDIAYWTGGGAFSGSPSAVGRTLSDFFTSLLI